MGGNKIYQSNENSGALKTLVKSYGFPEFINFNSLFIVFEIRPSFEKLLILLFIVILKH